ncbi:MAG: GH25 family lysozyme [Anaerolineaceae bacterium]|nr:GH25 family lysozyme [Anaerolineaceae bacterium]
MERAFGIDLNEFDSGKGRVNFDKIQAHQPQVSFIAARSGVSQAYPDPCFSDYWGEMGRIGVCRLAYHVVHFGDSALNQMDAFFKTVSGESNWALDRLALAFQTAGLNPKLRITGTAIKCLEICKTRTGLYPLVYSNALWLNANLDMASMPHVHYWLSAFEKNPLPLLYAAEHPGPPPLPMGVSTWLIHQTGNKCKSIGTKRHYMNYNRFNGSKDELHYYFGKACQVQPNSTSPLLFQARCIVTALYTRSGPAASYPVLGTISLGDVADVYELRDGWFRIDPAMQVWCSGSRTYMLPAGADEIEETPLFQIRVVAQALYKRSGPGAENQIVGTLAQGELAHVYEVQGTWYRIRSAAQVWCAAGPQYVETIQNPAAG